MSVRKSVFWAFFGQFISFATNLASSIVIARLLSPREMGIYAVAYAVLGALQIVAAFDMATYVVRAQKVDNRTLDSAFTVNALLALGLAAATLLVSVAGAAFLAEPEVARALRLLALGPLLGIIEFRPLAMIQRESRFRLISVVTVGRSVIAAAVGIAAAYAGASYMSLAYGNLAFASVGPVVYSLLAREHVRLRLSFEGWREMSAFGLRMMSISGLATLAQRLGDIILGKMLNLASLGLFSRASGISTLLFQNIYGTATRVVFVQLARDYREHGVLRDTFLRGVQMITAVMWPLLIGLAVLARPVILLMFGERWLGAAMPLSLLLIAQFVVLGFGMNWELFVLRDETALQTRFESIRAVVSLVLLVIGCTISITAAAASRIAEALVGLCLYLPHMRRLAGIGSGDIAKLYAQSGLPTVAAVAPAIALMEWNDWSAHTPWSQILAATAAGIALWLVAIWAIRHPLRAEFVVLGAKLRGAF